MILDDLLNIPTGREADDVSFYHAFDKIIQVLLRTRPHQHGFGLFAREQAIEILRRRVMRKIGLPVPILFYEILPKIVQIWDKYDSLLMTVHWTLIMSTKQVFFGERLAVGRSDEERKFLNYRKVIIEVPLILYLEVIQYGFVFVLCGETGVGQVAVGLSPMLDAAVVVQTQVFCNDEWCNGHLQALPE